VQQCSAAAGFQGNGAITGASSASSRAHELAANDLTSEKLRRLEIEHLGEFFSDTAECLRIVLLTSVWLNDFLFDR